MTEYTLAIDGSTYAGSVALLSNDSVIAERALEDRGIPSRAGRDELMLPVVAECIAAGGITVRDISRVVCGAGPGGFTSLRVAASIAKGLAVGSASPLFAVSSLLLALAAAPGTIAPGRYLSTIPAMRGELFVLEVIVDDNGGVRALGEARLLAENAAADLARAAGVTMAGPGAQLDLRPHARGVAKLLGSVIADGPRHIDTWEPAYGRLAEAQVRWEAAHGRPLRTEAIGQTPTDRGRGAL